MRRLFRLQTRLIQRTAARVRRKMLERVALCQRCFVASEEAAVAWVDERLDSQGFPQYLDRSGSVSALIEIENDSVYVPDHNRLFQRKIHNGS